LRSGFFQIFEVCEVFPNDVEKGLGKSYNEKPVLWDEPVISLASWWAIISKWDAVYL
jgi:hypothetical protein